MLKAKLAKKGPVLTTTTRPTKKGTLQSSKLKAKSRLESQNAVKSKLANSRSSDLNAAGKKPLKSVPGFTLYSSDSEAENTKPSLRSARVLKKQEERDASKTVFDPKDTCLNKDVEVVSQMQLVEGKLRFAGIVIPTANMESPDSKSLTKREEVPQPSTPFNKRLVSSTPDPERLREIELQEQQRAFALSLQAQPNHCQQNIPMPRPLSPQMIPERDHVNFSMPKRHNTNSNSVCFTGSVQSSHEAALQLNKLIQHQRNVEDDDEFCRLPPALPSQVSSQLPPGQDQGQLHWKDQLQDYIGSSAQSRMDEGTNKHINSGAVSACNGENKLTTNLKGKAEWVSETETGSNSKADLSNQKHSSFQATKKHPTTTTSGNFDLNSEKVLSTQSSSVVSDSEKRQGTISPHAFSSFEAVKKSKEASEVLTPWSNKSAGSSTGDGTNRLSDRDNAKSKKEIKKTTKGLGKTAKGPAPKKESSKTSTLHQRGKDVPPTSVEQKSHIRPQPSSCGSKFTSINPSNLENRPTKDSLEIQVDQDYLNISVDTCDEEVNRVISSSEEHSGEIHMDYVGPLGGHYLDHSSPSSDRSTNLSQVIELLKSDFLKASMGSGLRDQAFALETGSSSLHSEKSKSNVASATTVVENVGADLLSESTSINQKNIQDGCGPVFSLDTGQKIPLIISNPADINNSNNSSIKSSNVFEVKGNNQNSAGPGLIKSNSYRYENTASLSIKKDANTSDKSSVNSGSFKDSIDVDEHLAVFSSRTDPNNGSENSAFQSNLRDNNNGKDNSALHGSINDASNRTESQTDFNTLRDVNNSNEGATFPSHLKESGLQESSEMVELTGHTEAQDDEERDTNQNHNGERRRDGHRSTRGPQNLDYLEKMADPTLRDIACRLAFKATAIRDIELRDLIDDMIFHTNAALAHEDTRFQSSQMFFAEENSKLKKRVHNVNRQLEAKERQERLGRNPLGLSNNDVLHLERKSMYLQQEKDRLDSQVTTLLEEKAKWLITQQDLVKTISLKDHEILKLEEKHKEEKMRLHQSIDAATKNSQGVHYKLLVADREISNLEQRVKAKDSEIAELKDKSKEMVDMLNHCDVCLKEKNAEIKQLQDLVDTLKLGVDHVLQTYESSHPAATNNQRHGIEALRLMAHPEEYRQTYQPPQENAVQSQRSRKESGEQSHDSPSHSRHREHASSRHHVLTTQTPDRSHFTNSVRYLQNGNIRDEKSGYLNEKVLEQHNRVYTPFDKTLWRSLDDGPVTPPANNIDPYYSDSEIELNTKEKRRQSMAREEKRKSAEFTRHPLYDGGSTTLRDPRRRHEIERSSERHDEREFDRRITGSEEKGLTFRRLNESETKPSRYWTQRQALGGTGHPDKSERFEDRHGVLDESRRRREDRDLLARPSLRDEHAELLSVSINDDNDDESRYSVTDYFRNYPSAKNGSQRLRKLSDKDTHDLDRSHDTLYSTLRSEPLHSSDLRSEPLYPTDLREPTADTQALSQSFPKVFKQHSSFKSSKPKEQSQISDRSVHFSPSSVKVRPSNRDYFMTLSADSPTYSHHSHECPYQHSHDHESVRYPSSHDRQYKQGQSGKYASTSLPLTTEPDDYYFNDRERASQSDQLHFYGENSLSSLDNPTFGYDSRPSFRNQSSPVHMSDITESRRATIGGDTVSQQDFFQGTELSASISTISDSDPSTSGQNNNNRETKDQPFSTGIATLDAKIANLQAKINRTKAVFS